LKKLNIAISRLPINTKFNRGKEKWDLKFYSKII